MFACLMQFVSGLKKNSSFSRCFKANAKVETVFSNNLELDCCTAIQMSRQHSTIVSTQETFVPLFSILLLLYGCQFELIQAFTNCCVLHLCASQNLTEFKSKQP